MPPGKSDLIYPRIIAHRCGGALAPENTLAGLRLAARLGCKGVEFDVMLSRDGVPVLIHDETLERTTSGHGAVAAHSFAELRTLDAGAWHGKAYAGEAIPSLAAALALCAELGLWANVEIKPSAGREAETGAVVGHLLAAQWNGRGVVSSFSATALASAHTEAARCDFALLVDTVPADWRPRLDQLGCRALHCRAPLADPAGAGAVIAAGVPLACYTVNRRDQADALLRAGVAAVFTDRPDLWSPREM